MATPSESPIGWTIAEAIQRTSDHDESLKTAQESEDVESRRILVLLDRLLKGQLVLTRRYETTDASLAPIDLQILRSLNWSGSPGSILDGLARSDSENPDIRVFPVLHAPNAPTLLNGQSLVKTFRRYVFNDPEVTALAKRLSAKDAHPAEILREGRAPSSGVDYHWPLNLSAQEVADRFVESQLNFLDGTVTRPSAAILRFSEVLVARIERLRGLLTNGEIVALGTFVQSGAENSIASSQWLRNPISIDVRSGDLCEGHGYRAVAKWTGLSFRLPDIPVNSHMSRSEIPPEAVLAPQKAKSQIQTKQKAYLECVAWLVGQISASPEIRTASKSELWTEAQANWPKKFGLRAFEAAWAEAVAIAKAPAWRAAGRPKKITTPIITAV